MKANTKRRDFLLVTVKGGLGFVVLRDSLSARTYRANQKLNVAIVGCGGRGMWFVSNIKNWGQNLVAMCDVDEQKAAEAFKMFPEVPKFQDFRKMLDEMDKQIDAVIVSTPDHTHAVISVRAMRMGKHVFCEKPLAHNVYEARLMRQVAREKKVATQKGNQGVSSPQFRIGVELVWNGVIGEVKEIHVWNTGGDPGKRPRPTEEFPIPPHFNWDLWLGPAPYRPYHPNWLRWHGWRDFGTGQLGNWGSHTTALAFKALKLDTFWQVGESEEAKILRVKALCSDVDEDSYPQWEIVQWEFPARGTMPPVTVNWYKGSADILQKLGVRQKLEDIIGRKLDWGDVGEKKWRDWAGSLIVGSSGAIYGTGHSATIELLPTEKFKDVNTKRPEKLPLSRGPEMDWFEACKGGPAPWSNFIDFAGPQAEFYLLGNVATLFPDEWLEYDIVKGMIVNHPEANRRLKRTYRQGWEL
ncbi:MAG: Gfo/Idh/MocA family oxidoreductase [Armatimonadota bacterium]|nr:Gfo/Idh/MocA family oxidoreductase [Armatimonadota bacterium]MDW8141973.1 Gfo/Idh/MocA family oxidoreductase [Armatimonadota bacterium]